MLMRIKLPDLSAGQHYTITVGSAKQSYTVQGLTKSSARYLIRQAKKRTRWPVIEVQIHGAMVWRYSWLNGVQTKF